MNDLFPFPQEDQWYVCRGTSQICTKYFREARFGSHDHYVYLKEMGGGFLILGPYSDQEAWNLLKLLVPASVQ